MLTEASGIPLSVELAPANRHDMKLATGTMVQMKCIRPTQGKAGLDYDYDEVRRTVEPAGFRPVVMSRRDEKQSGKQRKGKARR